MNYGRNVPNKYYIYRVSDIEADLICELLEGENFTYPKEIVIESDQRLSDNELWDRVQEDIDDALEVDSPRDSVVDLGLELASFTCRYATSYRKEN